MLMLQLLTCLLIAIARPAAAESLGFAPTDSLTISSNVSSAVLDAGLARSDVECVTRCPQDRNCVVAEFNRSDGRCHVTLAFNQSESEASAESLVTRQYVSDSWVTVWAAENLQQRLLALAPSTVKVIWTKVFSATSSGSSGSIQSYTVSQTGCYRISAFGARGGTHYTVYDGSPSTTFSPKYWYGGRGAFKAGNFSLTSGTVLSIVVGQAGGNPTEKNPSYPTYPEDNAGAGGGGGSFVYASSGDVLYLAAGGGGGGSNGYQGRPGQSSTDGTDSVGLTSTQVGAGGSDGQPGSTNPSSASFHGGPGAGWKGRFATTRRGIQHGDRGGGLSEGWVGGVAGGMNSGAVGGFGGGGGGSEDNGASGGGGGFSGGGAGTHSKQAGGGGGSFCGGVSCEGVDGGNLGSDQGEVTVQLLSGSC